MLFQDQITVFRNPSPTTVGLLNYGGRTTANLTQITPEPVPASVQSRRDGQAGEVKLPADGTRAFWYIHTPRGALAKGLVKTGDVMVDDLDRHFQVTSEYWHNLGARFTVLRLEA